jgi:hypothetical protein
MISQRTLVIIMVVIAAAVLLVTVLGALIGHTGLFAFGAETSKYVISALVGVVGSAFAMKTNQRGHRNQNN